ncbi:XVIPCD domain-containing protein [Xanthomonas sp. 60]
MSGLTEKDVKVLLHYADTGNRELYWNYLAQLPGADGYGLLALGVVRNDSLPGRVANNYAQDYASHQSERGKHLPDRHMSERQWDEFGSTLLSRDLERRVQWLESGDPQRALNLPGKDVQQAHDAAFLDHGLDPNCWTPRLLLEAVREAKGDEAGERVWRSMLNNELGGAVRVWDTSGAALGAMPKAEAAAYLGKLTLLEAGAIYDRSNTDPNVVGSVMRFHAYDEKASKWYRVDTTDPYFVPREERDPAKLAELNDVRALRLERQAKATQFHAEDPNTSIMASPKTAALDIPQRGEPPRQLADLKAGDPSYALYTQIAEGVRGLDAAHGRSFDATSERLTASLLVRARESGLDRVDHVLLNTQTATAAAGEKVFLVQGALDNPAHKRVTMTMTDALQSPVEVSLARIPAAEEQARQVAAVQVEQQTVAMQSQPLQMG